MSRFSQPGIDYWTALANSSRMAVQPPPLTGTLTVTLPLISVTRGRREPPSPFGCIYFLTVI